MQGIRERAYRNKLGQKDLLRNHLTYRNPWRSINEHRNVMV
jgi:hypothetical protein